MWSGRMTYTVASMRAAVKPGALLVVVGRPTTTLNWLGCRLWLGVNRFGLQFGLTLAELVLAADVTEVPVFAL